MEKQWSILTGFGIEESKREMGIEEVRKHGSLKP